MTNKFDELAKGTNTPPASFNMRQFGRHDQNRKVFTYLFKGCYYSQRDPLQDVKTSGEPVRFPNFSGWKG